MSTTIADALRKAGPLALKRDEPQQDRDTSARATSLKAFVASAEIAGPIRRQPTAIVGEARLLDLHRTRERYALLAARAEARRIAEVLKTFAWSAHAARAHATAELLNEARLRGIFAAYRVSPDHIDLAIEACRLRVMASEESR